MVARNDPDPGFGWTPRGPIDHGEQAGWKGESKKANPYRHKRERLLWERGRRRGVAANARYLQIRATKTHYEQTVDVDKLMKALVRARS